jgi:alpha-mannosidase
MPFQRVRSHAAANGRDRLSFVASLPPLGYRTYRILPGDPQEDASPADEPLLEAQPVQAGDTFLENGRFRLELDPETNSIRSLYDKTAQVEVFCGPAALPVVLNDPSDTWSHNVFEYKARTAASSRRPAPGGQDR